MMNRSYGYKFNGLSLLLAILLGCFAGVQQGLAQGVTTASMSGIVTDRSGNPLVAANVVAEHEPSGTRYGSSTRGNGQFNIPNMRIGGPYTVTVTYIGYQEITESDVYLNLAQDTRIDFALSQEAIAGEQIEVVAELDDVLNSGRTGAATHINSEQVNQLPSVKRSTRDLTRLDPRSDGNFSFGGKNWLYNNISLDGSYFNNPFGLDNPAPGGQTNAEPVPFDAVEQVQVSVAPFDVREGGFTGAGINTVTKSGTNRFKGSLYTFNRNESLLGNTVRGQDIVANPDLSFMQSGFTVSGPLIRDKLFFFVNGELERRDDPGTNFVADTDGTVGTGESRVRASVMDQIRQRMITAYDYDPGPYQGFIHETTNNKLLAKLNWNINDNNNLSFRYNYLDAARDLPPHPFAISLNGRGPNETSLPFQKSGYTINNELHSFALEVNSRGQTFANRFFASYNRFRDFRDPNSEDFPTIEIIEDGVTYTTMGSEPFSIHNILDQDVLQITNNYTRFNDKHVVTFGATFETYSFFNSFNLFRNGFFLAPPAGGGTRFSSLDEFFTATDPTNPDQIDFRGFIGSGPFKGEEIDVGQLAVYVQDEYLITPNFNLTYGVRVDFPIYFTDPVDNPFSRGLTTLDEQDNPELVDQSRLPDPDPLFSPRVGFNWNPYGDRSTQVRGGTGIFTGRIPFVWFGNVISNPGFNPNLFPAADPVPTSDDAVLQQSFDLNAMVEDFKWPQIWTTNIAVDQQLPKNYLLTLELLVGQDINAIYMRNADLRPPIRFLADGRPFYGNVGFSGAQELNGDGAGVYVIDNISEGYNYNFTTQLRKRFSFGLNATMSYAFTQAKSQLKSTEIASVLWQENPVQGDPNRPNLSHSEFGHRHRVVTSGTYSKNWNANLATHIGIFFEAAEGNGFAGSGGNRYSYIYAGDVNGDGSAANDLIYVPANRDEINLQDFVDANGNTVTAAAQWTALNAFIEQDDYLRQNRGQIVDRFGAINPWYNNLDLRVLQDVALNISGQRHTFQISLDVLNVANLINSDWGVRKVASSSATSPLVLVGSDGNGEPIFNFTGPAETFIDDPSLNSRWQMQLGIKYFFD